jgi:hypothetical protein
MMKEPVNMCGITVRGAVNGEQERDLAAQCRRDAEVVRRWPSTSAMLLPMATDGRLCRA